MKSLFYLIIFLIIINCSTNKGVYWCGDHPCINKKERETYFKKTMIVEIKVLSERTSKNDSEIEKIIKQAQVEEKRRIKVEKDLAKQAKLDEKRRIKVEKDLAKQEKLDEKRRIKVEKDLAKRVESDEKRIIKKEKITSKQSASIDASLENIAIDSTNFKKLLKKITKKNAFRPYPNINDIPN